MTRESNPTSKYFQISGKECFKISVLVKPPTGPLKSPGYYIYICYKNNCLPSSFQAPSPLGFCPRKPSCTHLLSSIPRGYDYETWLEFREQCPPHSSCTDCSRVLGEVTSLLGLSFLIYETVWLDHLRCRDPLCDVPTTRRGPSLRGSDSAQSRGGAEYLVLLPSLPLLLNLLLLLQLLRHAGFPQGLALAPLVRFGVEGRLQGRVPSHAGHHLLSQLSRREWLEHLPWWRPDPCPPALRLVEPKRDSRVSPSQLAFYKQRNYIMPRVSGMFRDAQSFLSKKFR